jgi:hypothetical protein
MSHYVLRRGKYWEEYDHDPSNRGRKRFIRYWGRVNPNDPQARMAQMLDTAERKAAEIDAAQRARFGETATERREREEAETRFSPQTFLEETTLPQLLQSPPKMMHHLTRSLLSLRASLTLRFKLFKLHTYLR